MQKRRAELGGAQQRKDLQGEFVAGINRIQYNQGNGINAMAGGLSQHVCLPIRENLQTFMAWGHAGQIGWSRLRHASVGRAGIAGMAPMPWQVYGCGPQGHANSNSSAKQ